MASNAPAASEVAPGPHVYLDRTSIDWDRLTPVDLRTLCPYKGHTTGYWSARVGGRVLDDVAWSYDYPTRQLLPIAALVAFDDGSVTVDVSAP